MYFIDVAVIADSLARIFVERFQLFSGSHDGLLNLTFWTECC